MEVEGSVDTIPIWLLFMCWYLFIYIPAERRKRNLKRIQRNRMLRKKGGIRFMPENMLKELIGKEVDIMIIGELSVVRATVLEAEGNWIRVSQKNKVRYINTDVVNYINLVVPKEK